MIYYQQGLQGNTLHEMGGDPFEWLKGAIQPIEPGANLQTFKKSRAMYFISGKMNSKDGRAQRSNKNMIERDLVIMDVDSGEDHQAVAEWLDMLNYAALIYPTPRYEKDKQRFRIVLRADRPITSAESYKATIEAAAREIGIHCDPASGTWAQLQGAPISKEGAFNLIELEGNPFPVCEAVQFELQPDQAEADRQPSQEAPGDNRPEVKAIPYETALEIMKSYEERDRDNLKDRTNYLSAFMTIIQAVQTGEIDHDTGEACAVLLAGDNKEWQEGNREHFRNEIKKTIPRQEKTFLQKFDWKPGEVDEAHFQFDESDIICLADIEPKTIHWLWEDYIPFGMLSGIQGDPGSGKSYIMMKIAADITRGITPPNIFGEPGKMEPRNVVIVNGEDDLQHTIAPRLVAMNADRNRCFTLDERNNPLDFSQVKRIEAVIKRTRPALVIFDPIQAFLGAKVDMHRANEVRPVMTRIMALAQEYMFACCFVGHMNKYGGGKAQYRGLGSIDFSAIYRTQFLVGDNRKEQGAKLFVQIKNNLSIYAPAQGFRIEGDRNITWTGPDHGATAQDVLLEAQDREGSKVKEASDWLLQTLEESPYYATDLEEKALEADIPQRTLRRARSALVDAWKIEKGKVRGLNKWYWAIRGKEISYQEGLSYENEQLGQATWPTP